MYRLTYDVDAVRALKRMPANTASLIRTKLAALAADPLGPQPQAKRLTGSQLYRLRIGDWRAIYHLDSATRTVRVTAIKPRGAAYD